MENFGKKEISIFILIAILFVGIFYLIYEKEKLSPEEIEISRVESILDKEGLLANNKIKNYKIIYDDIGGPQGDGRIIIRFSLEKDMNAESKSKNDNEMAVNKYLEKNYNSFLEVINNYKESNIINKKVLKKLNDNNFLNSNNSYSVKEVKSDTDDNNFLVKYGEDKEYLLFISRI